MTEFEIESFLKEIGVEFAGNEVNPRRFKPYELASRKFKPAWDGRVILTKSL